jgi:hypothetical protein
MHSHKGVAIHMHFSMSMIIHNYIICKSYLFFFILLFEFYPFLSSYSCPFFCLHFLHHFHHFWIIHHRFTHIWHHSIIILASIMHAFVISSFHIIHFSSFPASCFSSFQFSFIMPIILAWFSFIISGLFIMSAIMPFIISGLLFHHPHHAFHHHFTAFLLFIITIISFDIISSLAIVYDFVLLSDFESTWFVDWQNTIN